MSYLAPSSTSSLQRIDRGATSGGSQGAQRQSACPVSIDILDDDSLINVFYLYRPFLFGEDEEDNTHLVGGKGRWVLERWWYKLAHVCQRWRSLILGSVSYLGVCLVCTNGTPVADMLAHSPPLPLVLDYLHENRDITTEDEEGIIFALKQRNRVRRIRLHMPVTNLQKLIVAINEEFPVLECLVIMPPISDSTSAMILPETLQAPHLRHLTLAGFALPIGSRLLTTALSLVTLGLFIAHPSTYLDPNSLLQWLSLTPQLEMLVITFLFVVYEEHIAHTPIMTPITLPNLHNFEFRGSSAYLEAFVHLITTPRLGKLDIVFFDQVTFSVPRLRQFINTTESLRFESAKFGFLSKQVYVKVYPRGKAERNYLFINVLCLHLHQQVSSMAQISDLLSQIFSAVEHLTLEHEVHRWPSGGHPVVDPTEWRKLLRPFCNAKTLRIDKGLVEDISRFLQLDDGELALELLPKLQELTYSGSCRQDAFTSFINARENAGRPVTLVHRSPSPDPSSSITQATSEAGEDIDT